MKVFQTPLFARTKRKLHSWQIGILDKEIKLICEDPTIGEAKKGDLAGVFVHKFKMKRDLYLLAYTYNSESRTLIMLGAHANFYRDLKRYQ
ncbi:MAG: type II toxin-antitoxin system RelE/ParE family toxin [Candidatus Marinimicrobia bacterium]|nr:type II toxin-antitoxin system RelE/ParE family toxin [Candidatus Neomarinimicrobiota bacterium]